MFGLSKILGFFALPSNLLFSLALLGILLMATRFRRFGQGLTVGAILGLVVFGFSPAGNLLIELLKKALPDCAEADIYWGYHFVTGALVMTLARTGRIDQLSHGLCRSDDFAAVKARMARFMAAGFRQVCGG